jgi:hypothetical protein
MFSNKTAMAGLLALGLIAGVHAQEKHLTLDDIDGMARQNLVDSMRKGTAQTQSQSAPPMAAAAPPTAAPPVVASEPAPPPKRPVLKAAVSEKQVVPVSFIGAYSDLSGSYVLYDFQGAIYPARQGAVLLNGWTVTHVDGYRVSVEYGKRKWTEVISTPVMVAHAVDVPSIQAINDLGSPLPPPGMPVGQPITIPLGAK